MQFPENPIMHVNESVCSEHIYMTSISPVGVGAPLQSAELMRCLLVLVCYGRCCSCDGEKDRYLQTPDGS